MKAIFLYKVKKGLQKRIKGRVSCWIINDTLVSDINPMGVYTYHFTISNISNAISSGLTSAQVVRDITKGYKNYILSEHFYFK